MFVGCVELVRVGHGRWVWQRRSQAGLVVATGPSHRYRWSARRSARRANGADLPVFIVKPSGRPEHMGRPIGDVVPSL